MSKSVFDKIGDIKNNINRSTFDWSHTNNFTTGLGRITPVFCELCPPASSLKIKPDYGLQFMPMMFPVQTKMKSYLSFYRVPLRTLWKDYMDFTSGIPGQTFEPPYIKFPANAFDEGGALRVSSLADYLGIPVTTPQRQVNWTIEQFPQSVEDCDGTYGLTTGLCTISSMDINKKIEYTALARSEKPSFLTYSKMVYCPLSYQGLQSKDGTSTNLSIRKTFGDDVDINKTYRITSTMRMTIEGYMAQSVKLMLEQFPESMCLLSVVHPKSKLPSGFPSTMTFDSPNLVHKSFPRVVSYGGFEDHNAIAGSLVLEFDIVNYYYFCVAEGSWKSITLESVPTYWLGCAFNNVYFRRDDTDPDSNTFQFNFGSENLAFSLVGSANSASELDKYTCPYDFEGSDSSKNPIKISAYPFRAYEAIYNAYIRNTRNNPFMLNGKPVYNKWITNDNGGKDSTTPLYLRQANWASDAFTTALTAPQQGKAPLVGITTYADTHTDENGHIVNDMKFALVDEDGKKYGLTFVSNGDELKSVEYSELSSNQPVRPISSLFDLATSGISINDFRNVNAYQRYLELNQFRGFSYKEIVEGRFDVNVKYDALNMPEYLGGITRDVVVNPVTQTVETSNTGTYSGALGSQAGIAGVRGNSDGTISVYCDEESLVVGIISVVPMPVYTQVLPKHFLYRDRLDSYNPEFDHIGYQPIGLSELCPILDFVQNGKNTNATFGYQRPWYDYVQKRDSAHGIFRTQLRNFLINRVFNGVPELGAEFTTIDERDVNSVFSVTETTDKIFGQIYFDVTAKLPISRVVVPKLE